MIDLKRAYEPSSPKDGERILVERLWPRGVKKERLHLDVWMKEVAPSTELRKWFSHDPVKWNEFRRRYFEELNANREAWQPLLEKAQKRHLTLIYSAHDEEHNAAVALKQYLQRKLTRHSRS